MKLFIFVLIPLFSCSVVFAAEKLDQLNYPELEVVPRASEVVLRQARSEKEDFWWVHRTYTLPSAMLLFAGINSSGRYIDSQKDEASHKKSSDDAATAAIVLGTSGLFGGLALGYWYTPYTDSFSYIRRIRGKTDRSQLEREREAERAIRRANDLAENFNYIYFGASFIGGVAVASNNENEVSAMGAFAALMSLIPLAFDHPYENVHDDHFDHRRRIYRPITQLYLDPKTQAQGMSLTWLF